MDEKWLIVSRITYLEDWDNLWRCFSEPVADTFYRPLLIVSFIIDAHLGGLNPFVYHLSNVVLHILSTLVLYRLLLKLNCTNNSAALLSLLFTVHPVLTHAVAWVPGRNDVLLGLFSLLSFLFLLKYLEHKTLKTLGYHFLFFACALLSKETAVILPLVYGAILFYSRSSIKDCAKPVIGWLVLALLWFLIKTSVVPDTKIPGNKVFLDVLEDMGPAFLIYLGKLIWPFNASVIPTIKNTSLIPGIISLILLVSSGFVAGIKNKRLVLTAALLFFSGLILPVFFRASGNLGEHYEHRIYLPLVGFILFISQLQINFETKLARQITVVIILAMGTITFVRSGIYGSPLQYVEEGIEDSPNNYIFHVLRGNILYEAHRFDESLISYNRALALQPKRIQTLANRANVYAEMGEKDLAIADLDAALKIGSSPNIFLNKINVYYRFGEYDNALTNFELLAAYDKNYLLLIPKNISQHLSQLYAAKQSKRGQTIELTPKQAEAIKNLASFDAAIKKEPKNAVYYVHRAKAYVDLKRWEEALADLKHACQLDPKNKDYKNYYDALNNSMPH